MPGTEYPEGDLFPETKEELDELRTWALGAWQAADNARRPFETKWRRYFRLYRSYVGARKAGEWRSRVFMPETFQTVETILPKLVAQLPKFMVLPHGPEDVRMAKTMETLLEWAVENSNVHMPIIDAFRDALIYGTGILKTFHTQEFGYKRETQVVMEDMPHTRRVPLLNMDGSPMLDIDGNPMVDEVEEIYQIPAGTKTVRSEFVSYDGPGADCIDPFNFWVSPEAETIDGAKAAFHRVYTPWTKFQKRVAEGVYHLPEGFDPQGFMEPIDDPHRDRLDSIELGPGIDPQRRDIELIEIYTDDRRLITLANRREIVRVSEFPFDHGQKPFIPVYDYRQSHQFWGVGEVEILEGLQDLINALTNQRIDNVRLGMDQGWAYNRRAIKDARVLKRKPGQLVPMDLDGMNPQDVIWPLPTTEVTQSAFAEVDQAKTWSERATANSSYQQGLDTPSQADTATGIAMLQEAGNTRNFLKAAIAEMDSFKRLGLHFGSILQQFITEPIMVRLNGPDGSYEFEQIDPLSLQGAFDFTIQPASVAQSETVKKEQAMRLFQTLAPVLQMPPDPNTGQPIPLPPGLQALVDDVLDAFGKKDKERFLAQMQPQPPQMPPEQPPIQ